jgi:hypothetical protein
MISREKIIPIPLEVVKILFHVKKLMFVIKDCFENIFKKI